jgi:hypothetical protein
MTTNEIGELNPIWMELLTTINANGWKKLFVKSDIFRLTSKLVYEYSRFDRRKVKQPRIEGQTNTHDFGASLKWLVNFYYCCCCCCCCWSLMTIMMMMMTVLMSASDITRYRKSQNSSVIVCKLLSVAVAVNRFTLCACQVKHQNGNKTVRQRTFSCRAMERTQTDGRLFIGAYFLHCYWGTLCMK